MSIGIDEVRKFFMNDRFAVNQTGAVIEEIGDKTSLVSMDIEDHHLNGNNSVQGGVMFTIADYSCAVASYSGGRLSVSVDGNISFLKAPRGKKLYARATCLREGRTMSYYESLVTDDTETAVAKASFTMYRVK